MLPFYLEKIMPTPSTYTTEELMETFKQISSKMKADVRVEFDAGRIAGSQYAEVYLGMLTAALQGSLQFYLTKDSAWAQYALQVDTLAVSKERHGMNFKPAFSQE